MENQIRWDWATFAAGVLNSITRAMGVDDDDARAATQPPPPTATGPNVEHLVVYGGLVLLAAVTLNALLRR